MVKSVTTMAIVVTRLGHALLRKHGETDYQCQHCWGTFNSWADVRDWCGAPIGRR